MKKTLPIISTFSILLASFIMPTASTSAMVQKDDGLKMWSVAEMIELDNEVEITLNNNCGDNEACRLDLYQNLINSDSKYAALTAFRSKRFMFTYLNFTDGNEWIGTYYRNSDPELARIGLYEYTGDLKELYVIWAGEFAEDPSSAENEIPSYAKSIREYGSTGMDIHQVLVRTDGWGGTRPYDMANVELNYEAFGSQIIENDKQYLNYFFYVSDGTSLASTFDYSGCIGMLSDTDEINGIECRLMFTESGEDIYIPFRNNILVNPAYTTIVENNFIEDGSNLSTNDPDDSTNGPDDILINTFNDDISGLSFADSNEVKNPNNNSSTQNNTTNTGIEDNNPNLSISPKTPDTGIADTTDTTSRSKTIELLAMILALINILLARLVYVAVRKSLDFPKKGVDNSRTLR